MNRIFLLAIFLSSAVVYGQEKNEWRVGAHFQLNDGFESKSSQEFAPGGCYEPNYSKLDLLEFTTGIDVNYRMSKNFELSTGVDYTRRNYEVIYYCGCFGLCDYIFGTPHYTREHFIETPLIGRYYVLPNNFKMHFELGQVVGLPTRFNGNTLWDNIKLDVHAGLGVDYFVGRFQMAASVNYRRNWQSMLRTEIYYNNCNRLGVELKTAVRLGAI